MADIAHAKTDQKLEEMEKRLSAIYSRAEKEIQKTADEYFSKFAKQDEAKRKLLEQGKITEDEYTKWRKGKVMYGKRFTEMKEQCAKQLLNVNQTALAYVNGELPKVYALNYNALASSVDGVGGYSFTLVDADTVRNLAVTDTSLLPYKQLDPKKDIPWNMKKINAETLQGILQGESMDKIAKRLRNVQEMNKTQAIRSARTIVTGAENKGRQDSYARAEADGIILQKEWLSTNDGRTRHSHAALDGAIVDQDKKFDNGLMYPGDPSGRPEEVYNCRCTLVAKVNGFNKVQYNKSHGLAPTNRDGKEIVFSEKMQNGKWNESVDIITELSGQYKTKLLDVGIGSEKSAGSVQISGSVMRLSSTSKATAVHEFAHTISMENQTKFGLYDEKDFWKEIRGVQRKYKKAVANDSRKWISSYEHSSQGADEFMAEAFTHAQMKEMGLELPSYYGEDFTYSEMVLKIIKKYFGR
jgi:SPP1 gp7 family putative phage head morphogenesis protein